MVMVELTASEFYNDYKMIKDGNGGMKWIRL